MTVSKPEAVVLVQQWQERLRLTDWRILIDIKRAKDLDLEGKEATIQRLYPSRIAWIALMDPIDYPADCALPQDHEVNIVHELLHLYFGYFKLPEAGPMHIWEEQAITAISGALVILSRAAQAPGQAPSPADSSGDLSDWVRRDGEQAVKSAMDAATVAMMRLVEAP